MTSPIPTPTPTPTTSIFVAGYVQAGKQPVSYSAVSLYAAGNSGNGSPSTDLLSGQSVSTDATGRFSIPSSFKCPSSPIYLVARGGVPSGGRGTSNNALWFIAALGQCDSVNSATQVVVSETTTVAAVWSLSQFLGPNANVGSTATNLRGLQSAFSLAQNLADPVTGSVPGSAFPSSARTETLKIDSLASIVSTCANSDGATDCNSLFKLATRGGASPTNTLDALRIFAKQPAESVEAIFSLQGAAPTFQPALTSAPNDWTVSATYGVCASGCGGLNIPTGLGVDSRGNVWVANYNGSILSEFSPFGVPLAPNGFAGSGLRQSYGLTIDKTDQIWVTNEQSVAGSASRRGSVSRFSASGSELSGFGYTAGGVYYPHAIAADSNGGLWVADYGSSSASLLASDGTAISGSDGFAASLLPFTTAVAVDAVHNGWFAYQGGVARISSLGQISTYACCNQPTGVAVGPNGDVWLADYGGYSLVELSADGNVLQNTSTFSQNVSPLAIAIDSAGKVWSANYFGNSISALNSQNGTGATLSTFGRDAGLSEPYAIAVDAGGNLWLTNSGNDTLTEIIGFASPIRTPLLGPPVAP